ncbi:aspartyl protease [Microcystis sp. MC19]|uniref:ATP-dependent zinc protease family protein n=1 Tax=Microcystis sp. MC19 TaxID=1967666 RepID=UPI000D12682C|nr:RimK/LysX family protein [Microcystis sp. MC19]AVQ71764.1 aspartyl protease [Microcystis sp. MC19]
MKPDKIIIGWREWLDLPDLGITKIKAKIDTGARSSSLHAFHLHRFPDGDRSLLRFQVHPYQKDSRHTVTTTAEILEWRRVKNSGGQSQLRPVIRTSVLLGGHQWAIELTLTNRDVMGFRMLLGREALKKGFLVHPNQSFLLS